MSRPDAQWQPMASAPRDGAPFQARIPGHGEDNIIAWVDTGHCHADALLHLANAPSDDAARDLLRRWRVFGPYGGVHA